MSTNYRLYNKHKDEDRVLTLNLPEATKMELALVGRGPWQERLLTSIEDSDCVYVMEHNGVIQGIGGLVVKSCYGIPWFVNIEQAEKYPIFFYKTIKSILSDFLQQSGGLLVNFIWVRHGTMIKMLRRLGFTVGTDIKNIAGLAMLQYHKEDESCAHQ